jgi:hypothetical protein
MDCRKGLTATQSAARSEKTMKNMLLLALAAISLAACETPNVYGPAASPSASGYSETPIEQGRWRVTFHGGSGASVQRVDDLALLRSAELTLAQGYDWFRVTDRYTQTGGGGGGPFLSLGGGGGSFGRGSAVGVGGDVGFDLSGGPRVTRSLDIVMGRGDRPSDPDVYDARQVKAAISPRA